MKRFVLAGIGTDVGKTVASAVLTETLGAAYWKPVQTGSAESADRLAVERLCAAGTKIIPGAYHFAEPASPHLAGTLEGVEIDDANLVLPALEGTESLVLEIAGGIMVPLNNSGLLTVEMLQRWKLPVFVVTKHYLGSINHTLLTLSELKNRQIEIAGVILNGQPHEPTESVYRKLYPELLFLELPELEELSAGAIAKVAQEWKKIIG